MPCWAVLASESAETPSDWRVVRACELAASSFMSAFHEVGRAGVEDGGGRLGESPVGSARSTGSNPGRTAGLQAGERRSSACPHRSQALIGLDVELAVRRRAVNGFRDAEAVGGQVPAVTASWTGRSRSSR